MAKSAVCPYYGCNEDICDVGCGYISSHDASQISRYCSADYQGCPNLHEAIERDKGELYSSPVSPVTLQKNPTAVVSGEAGVAIGLSVTGVAILLYAFQKFGLFGTSIHFSGSLILIISVMQLAVGMVAMKKVPVRGMMFMGSGLLWASMLAMDLLPAAGIGSSPGKYALSGYLYLWGLFCLFPLQAAVRVTLYCRFFFGLLAVYLLLQAVSPYFSTSLDIATFVVGSTAGLVGIGASLRFAMRYEESRGGPVINRV